ncbi:hypothetical protein V4F39_20400 [Aquincola sp. MAHUQ-54]|uniref:Uncharacterized protein n=1 Tax=Aquincola agrisoli TaxID=3119538 RepID=A0AAW9QL39_9BURK
MDRTTTSAEHLRDLIRAEAARRGVCNGVFLSGVEPHEPDADGCNWGLAGVRGAEDPQATAACLQSLDAFVQDLRARYKLPDTR